MQNWLPYIFVALMVALLPVLAPAANHHASHQHASEHGHTSGPVVAPSQQSQEADSAAGDQHGEAYCCHSPSIVATLRANHEGNLYVAQFRQDLPEYYFVSTSTFLFPDFRPPIV